MNILFTSAGRRVVLLKLFRQALQALDEPGQIVAVDMNPTAPAFQVADCAYVVPKIKEETYIPALLEVCARHAIDAIFPCFDPDLSAVAGAYEQFASLGARPVVSNFLAVQTCFNKYSTYEFFTRHGIPTVKTWRVLDFSPQDGSPFPLFVKPLEGFGSINSRQVRSFQELEAYRAGTPDAVVQELARGTEFTIDVLADFNGQVISAVPRQRIEVRAGEISKGVTRKDRRLMAFAETITSALQAVGPLCIQCFVDGDRVRFTEINPRFGGGVPLSVAAGADQVRWVLQLLRGESLEPRIGDFQENLIMLRYDEAFFLPETTLEHFHA